MDLNNIFLLFILISNFFVNLLETRLVNTTSGTVKGTTLRILNETIEYFVDIPYAEPPIGKLRFAKPQPLQRPVYGIIDDSKPRRSCAQPSPNLLLNNDAGHVTEDCLTINIWSPQYVEGNKLKPVMFWIYGGALMAGSIHTEAWNTGILPTYDVVLVMPNYRVGWFGFLYGGDESAPGNVGLFDQVLALKWTRENIHLFGGDKNQITIFGVSSGSWSVSAHIISPISKGLFKRAILMEGAHLYNKNRPKTTKEEALNKAKELARRKLCEGNQWLECLRGLETEDFLDILPTQFLYPVDDTEFLPMTARRAFEEGKFNGDIDLLAGFAKDEGSLGTYLIAPLYILKKDFTMRDCRYIMNSSLNAFNFPSADLDKFVDFYFNDVDLKNNTALRWKVYQFVGHLLICPTYYYTKLYAQHSAKTSNVFLFELTHNVYKGFFGFDWGVHHGTNAQLAFGLPISFPNSTAPENLEFSFEYIKLITDFAKTGKPDPNWPKLVGTSALPELEFIKDMNPHNKSKYHQDYFKHTCNGIWKDYF